MYIYIIYRVWKYFVIWVMLYKCVGDSVCTLKFHFSFPFVKPACERLRLKLSRPVDEIVPLLSSNISSRMASYLGLWKIVQNISLDTSDDKHMGPKRRSLFSEVIHGIDIRTEACTILLHEGNQSETEATHTRG